MDCNGGGACKTIISMVEVLRCEVLCIIKRYSDIEFLLLDGGVPLMAETIWLQNTEYGNYGFYPQS